MAIHGKNAKISYSAATLIKDGNSWSLSIDGGVGEVPEFGDEWNYRLVGLRDWTATIDLNLDMTSTQQATVQTWILGTTPSTATFRFYINATNYYEGVGWVGTEDVDVSVTDPESISFGVSGHGTLTYT